MKLGYAGKRVLRGLLLLGVVLLAWEGLYRVHVFNHCLWPSVFRVGQTLVSMIASGELQKNLGVSLARILFGFVSGTFIALGVAFTCIISKRAAFLVEPLVYLSFPVPRFILLPFIVILFGAGWFGNVVFLSIGAFYPLVINTVEGFRSLDRNYMDVAVHYGASGWNLYRRVIFPGTLPALFTGLRIGFGFTLTYTIILEYLNTDTGLGAVMWLSLQTLQIDKLAVMAIMVAAINMTFVFLLIAVEQKFTPWSSSQK
ncbi:MAG: ABC transporter permease [Candidatus Omnitrophica bacterium]|nr:ABC transporter permease [Candidatus Omnitrophota bacterium]